MEKCVVQAFFSSWIVRIFEVSLAYRSLLRCASVLALGACCLVAHPLGGMASKEGGFSLLNDLGQTSDLQRKKEAKQTLRRLGRRALPLLIQGLERSRHAQLHREIYALLHSLGEEAAPALRSILRAAARHPSLHPQVIPLFARLGTKVLDPLQEIAASSAYPLAQRFLAARGIGAFGSRAWRYVPQLIALVEGESPLGLRSAAIAALGDIGPMAKESIPALLEAMKNRRLAGISIQALAKIGVAALPSMRELLDHPSPIMRRRGIKVIGLLGEKSFSFRHALLRRLHDNDQTVRREAAKSLHRIGIRVLPALRLALLEQAPWRQRANAAYTLGLFKEAALPALPELKHALNDPHWKIRRSAAFALSKIGPAASSAAPLLKKALHDPSVEVRHYAVTALLRFSIPQQPLLDALDALLQRTPHLNEMLFLAQHLDHLAPQRYTLDTWQKIYLRTRNYKEKKRSLQGLRAYKKRALPAVPAILSLLHQASSTLQKEIAQTLLSIGQETTPRLLTILRTPNHPLLLSTLQLARFLHPFAHHLQPYLLQHTQHSPTFLAKEAMLALARFGDLYPSNLSILQAFSTHRDFLRRHAAILAIKHFQGDILDALPAILRFAQDLHWATREEAILALHKILQTPRPPAISLTLQNALLAALKDEDPIVRGHALLALRQAPPPTARWQQLLRRHLTDPYPRNQKIAAQALKQAVPSIHIPGLLQAQQRAKRFLRLRSLRRHQRRLAEEITQPHMPPPDAPLWQRLQRSPHTHLPALRYALRYAKRETKLHLLALLHKPAPRLTPLFPVIISLMGQRETDSQLQQALIAFLQRALPHSLPPLKAALRHPDPKLVREACITLGRFRHAALPAFPDLLHALRRRYTWQEALSALRQLGPAVLPHVMVSIEHPHQLVRARLLSVIGYFPQHAQPFLPYLQRSLSHPFTQIRWKAAQSLEKMGSHALPALDALQERLHDRSFFVRKSAALAIAALGPAAAKAIPPLLRAHRHERDFAVRRSLHTAILRLGGNPDIRLIGLALRDPLPDVRRYAARTLALLQEDADLALPSLQLALYEPLDDIRRDIFLAIAQSAPPTQAYAKLLQDHHDQLPPEKRPPYQKALQRFFQRAAAQKINLFQRDAAQKSKLLPSSTSLPTASPSSLPTASPSSKGAAHRGSPAPPSPSTRTPSSLPTSIVPKAKTLSPSPRNQPSSEPSP